MKAGGGQHIDMLDEAVRVFVYLHRHRVDQCLKYFHDFQGPMQPQDLSEFIALDIADGARGYEMLQRAIEEGLRLSADRRHILFDHPDDEDVNGHLAEVEDHSERIE